MKKFLKDLWNNGLAYDMKVIAAIFIVAIIIVVIVCGIYGNNDQNFWRKSQPEAVSVVEASDALI